MGYELLFRSAQGSPGSVDGDRATTEVILNTFSEIGIENLVGEKMAFINFTRNFLTGELPIPFPPGQTVIEVLEDIKLDRSVLSDLASLAQKGFTIAMDDVVNFERVKPSIGLAKIVKIDFPFVRKDDLAWLVRKIRESGMWPLAEKVETQEEYQFCKSVGFELFQGYYFSKPSIIHGSRIDSSRMIILHALALLQDPNINFQMLEDVLQRDVTLSYKLLKLSNSAYYSQHGKVNSISQTIGLIGITQLSGWLTLMLISSTENKPHELTTIALLRAKLCESLGKLIGYPDTNTLFMVGLFSVLDALFDTPIDKVLSSLPIAPDVANALLTRSGQAGQLYSLVLLLESGQLEYASALGLPVDIIRKAYVQSVRWTNDVIAKTEATLKSS
jgi:EAL and modified HD-GYP domain-containing signal transduction protein